MAAALSLAQRGHGRTGRNPSVGCLLVKDNCVIGRGWTQSGGRPHAEAMALAQAGKAATGATLYVTLEPCAHESERGPACAEAVARAKPARVVIAIIDPDPRTAGKGIALLQQAGIAVEAGILSEETRRSLAGFLSRVEQGRPHITLKLAISLDGKIAMADGQSRWITGDAARAHVHLERSRADAILVGAGTVKADAPRLDVRLSGLESRSPRRIMLGNGAAPEGWEAIGAPRDISSLDCNHVFVEGGAQTASAFVKDILVDRLLLYRAPILIGNGIACLGDIGLETLGSAHGRWMQIDERQLGNDRLEAYEAVR